MLTLEGRLQISCAPNSKILLVINTTDGFPHIILVIHQFIVHRKCFTHLYMFTFTWLKVGQMTWTIWVTFLVCQVGLICKLNYLDVTQISHVLRKTVVASDK